MYKKKLYYFMICNVKVKVLPLHACQASTGGGRGVRSIDLPILDSGIRRRKVVSATPKPFYPRGRDPLPILQEAGRNGPSGPSGWVRKTLISPGLESRTVQPGKNPVPVPLCPPQILHGLTRNRTRASTVRSLRLIA